MVINAIEFVFICASSMQQHALLIRTNANVNMQPVFKCHDALEYTHRVSRYAMGIILFYAIIIIVVLVHIDCVEELMKFAMQ